MIVETDFKKLQKFDSSYFRGKNYFDDDDTKNYLVFQPKKEYFKTSVLNNKISSWKSKGLHDEEIKSFTVSGVSTASELTCIGDRMRVKLEGDCLKQDKVTYSYGAIINIYAVYKSFRAISASSATLDKCLFGAVTLTKHHDIHKYKYSGNGIGFDSKGTFSHPSGGVGKNVIIFGADMSSFVHANNKAKTIIVLGEGFTQGLEDTKLYAILLKIAKKKFLSFHYNGADSYLFVNGKEIHRFKAKDSEIVETPICLGNISKDFSMINMLLTWLKRYIYVFSVDYRAIAADKILDIHKYLMEKNNII